MWNLSYRWGNQDSKRLSSRWVRGKVWLESKPYDFPASATFAPLGSRSRWKAPHPPGMVTLKAPPPGTLPRTLKAAEWLPLDTLWLISDRVTQRNPQNGSIQKSTPHRRRDGEHVASSYSQWHKRGPHWHSVAGAADAELPAKGGTNPLKTDLALHSSDAHRS